MKGIYHSEKKTNNVQSGDGSDYQYDRYSPWVTANGFMNFVYMPYNCSAD